jgi:hypothetical protein
MITQIDKLGIDLGPDLASIRSAVGKLTGARLPWDAESPVDLVDQGDRMVLSYENWLLDDEQKQMLNEQPGDKLILYAASYLCDIGLTDGQGFPSQTKDIGDDRLRVFFNRSLPTRSCQMIRDNWQELGIAEREYVDIITRICMNAAMAEGDNLTPVESEAAVPDDATVKVPLLAAHFQLCRANDLKSPAAIVQISSHLSKDNRISPGRLETYFRVADTGAHPYLNATIRLKIQCTHPEVHRALKHHERSVQQLLEKLNRRVRPRFLYTDVLYEIEPDGYSP